MYASASAAMKRAIFDTEEAQRWTRAGTPPSSTMRRALPGLKARFQRAPAAVSWTSWKRYIHHDQMVPKTSMSVIFFLTSFKGRLVAKLRLYLRHLPKWVFFFILLLFFFWVSNLEACRKYGPTQEERIGFWQVFFSMIKVADESADHLFIHCRIATVLWHFPLFWNFIDSPFLLRTCWRLSWQLCGQKKKFWRTTPPCLFLWIIWKEQNRRTFKGKQKRMRNPFKICKSRSKEEEKHVYVLYKRQNKLHSWKAIWKFVRCFLINSDVGLGVGRKGSVAGKPKQNKLLYQLYSWY